MTSLDPQKVYAFSALEKATAKTIIENTPAPAQVTDRQINSPQEAIDALREAVDLKLRVMLGSPDNLSFGAIKDLKQSMELLDSMQAKYVPAGSGAPERKGLSDETVEDIKKRILGLK